MMPGLRVDGGGVGAATVKSAEECCSVCQATVGCRFFTFVLSKSLCWLKSNGKGQHHNDTDFDSGGSDAPFKCSSDESCNHAGQCNQGVCECDAPFHGEACETFSLYS